MAKSHRLFLPPHTARTILPAKINHTAATRETCAKRFFNKDHTRHDDLLGAVSYWIAARMPRKSLGDFLESIVPDSGWVEDRHYDPSKPTRRSRADYGQSFHTLISGWDQWQ